jgi:outer membrane receptor protein involved in Fe transport
MVNLNTGVHWNDNLDLGFFAQNLLNDRGFTGPDVIEQAAPRARPRTYGASFRVRL